MAASGIMIGKVALLSGIPSSSFGALGAYEHDIWTQLPATARPMRVMSAEVTTAPATVRATIVDGGSNALKYAALAGAAYLAYRYWKRRR